MGATARSTGNQCSRNILERLRPSIARGTPWTCTGNLSSCTCRGSEVSCGSMAVGLALLFTLQRSIVLTDLLLLPNVVGAPPAAVRHGPDGSQLMEVLLGSRSR